MTDKKKGIQEKPAPQTNPYERIMAIKLLPIYRRWVADGRPVKA